MARVGRSEIRISNIEIRNKFKILISKCSKQIVEHKKRDPWVLVIVILSIRICFVLPASNFGFGFECTLCSMPKDPKEKGIYSYG